MSNALAHGELSLFDCPRIRKSEFWQFIKLVAPHGSPPDGRTHWLSQDATDAYCLRCSKMFRFTKGSSNSVRRHMERFHRKELLKRQADSKKNAAVARKISTGGAGASTGHAGIVASSSASANASVGVGVGGSGRKPKRPTSAQDAELLVDDAAQRAVRRPRADGGPTRDARYGVEALVKWLVSTMRSFSLVDEPGFAAFAEAISGDYPFVVPTRDALCHRLELMSENTRFEAKQTLKKDVRAFALTAEIWRTRVSDTEASIVETHVAITCVYLREDFTLQSCVVDALPIEAFSCDRVLRLLQDTGLTKTSLSLFLLPRSEGFDDVGSATSDMRAVVDVAFSLNELVSGLLRSNSTAVDSPTATRPSAMEAIHSALAEVMSFVEWVRSDSTAHGRLETLFPAAAVELSRFPAPDLSTWSLGTAHDVVSRAVLMRCALDRLIDQWGEEDDLPSARTSQKITPASWFILEGLLVLWRPLYEVVQVATNEKVCSLPFVLPILTMAMQLFARVNLFDELQQRYAASGTTADSMNSPAMALETLRSVLESGLRERYENLCSALSWISALDPRYARLRHLSDPEREACKKQLLEHAIDVYASHLPPVPVPAEPLVGSVAPPEFESDMLYGDARTPGQSMPGLMHRLLYDEDEDVPVTPDPGLSRESELAQARLYVANEISVYLNEHQLRKTRIVCPLEWWSTNRERFPLLAPLARQWLSTRACVLPGAFSDRLISAGLSESLGSNTQKEKWLKLTGDAIVLLATCHTVTSSGVSL